MLMLTGVILSFFEGFGEDQARLREVPHPFLFDTLREGLHEGRKDKLAGNVLFKAKGHLRE